MGPAQANNNKFTPPEIAQDGKITSAKDTKPSNKRHYIAQKIKNSIWQRAQGCCEYVDPSTNKRCNDRFGLQLDHIQAHARGGSETVENLRLLCCTHNQLHAISTFGVKHMQQFVPSIN